ncbi:hypothetical protein K388_02720 [Streptomyces sp. KhCrAH-43]|uniref:hypothetical protein n=1 Tax=unclassified Streptomyces TaxID=2593676 RepID=UPI0003824093|nr:MULTISPECIES: hypothetical protein [unclassified Streptomyces]MYS36711.1 hypothetical protein [Streptomyces sp. SID4920]MYX69182.1 hypothetical protein [Streptomyces sp. SID8373]RAJ62034.1 hypothetical protein K388_02720 [Streptomyces sp. KhCrAH-43]
MPTLEDFASALAARLPGDWTSTYEHHARYTDQYPTTNRLWDNGHLSDLASLYALEHWFVLRGPEDQALYVISRPLCPHEAVVAPIEPDRAGIMPHHFFGVEEPSGIVVPADPVRAAAAVTRRLLPRYEQALQAVLRKMEEQPEPPHRAAPAPTSRVITLARYADDVIGAPYESIPPDARETLYAHGFQYHPHQSAFLLPVAYGDTERALRIQSVAQKLAAKGIGVNLRYNPPEAATAAAPPARPAAPAPAHASGTVHRR